MDGLAKDGRSALNHELNRDGTACSEDCPACLYMRIKVPAEPNPLWSSPRPARPAPPRVDTRARFVRNLLGEDYKPL
jgi:hypothetical protein